VSATETLPADLDKILSLLREYTVKLRDVCQRELDRRYRFTVIQVGTLLSAAAGGLVLFQLLKGGEPALKVEIGSAALVMAALLATAILLGSRRYSYDAEEVAYTLARLIETALQFSEHASSRISDKFEFDLRVAEAEAVVRMYKKVFGAQTHPQTQKA
jgi:hypothetical protein